MGTLLGHIVPGTFFILFSIWWEFYLAIKHYQIEQSQKKSIYYSTTTFPCFFILSTRNIFIESYLKLFYAIIGMIGEFLTGFTHTYNEISQQYIWTFGENNIQHITMFSIFALASLIEILVHKKYILPNGIEFLANIFAYGIQGFLFHFHLHGRNSIDIHVHTLLIYAILFCLISTIWEYNYPNQILATYARISATFLQGVWFYAIAFILYFPSTNPYWIWLPSHDHMLLITTIFIWCALSICIFLFIQSIFIWYLMKWHLLSDNINQMQFNNELCIEF